MTEQCKKTRERNWWIPKLLALAIIIVGIDSLIAGIVAVFSLETSAFMQHYMSLTHLSKLQRGSGAVSIILGLFLLLLGKGLYQQRFTAWIWSLLFLMLTFANAALPVMSLHTLVLSAVFILLLVLNRKHFFIQTASADQYQMIFASFSVVFSLAYGIIGSYVLRDQFHGLHTWLDAVYYTLVTYSTVGYGDIVPTTVNAKVFTITMIVVGIGSFVTALGVLIGPMIQRNIKGVYRMVSHLNHLSNHVLLCGDNVLTRTLADDFMQQQTMCYFLVDDPNQAARLENSGYSVMSVDPADKDQLEACNVENAKCFVAAYDDDALNILVLMTAKSLAQDSDVKIVARIEHAFNVKKAELAGAHQVISPLQVSAQAVLNHL